VKTSKLVWRCSSKRALGTDQAALIECPTDVGKGENPS
jgi:hypothetical protein